MCDISQLKVWQLAWGDRIETHTLKRITVLSNPSVGIMAVIHVKHTERVFGLCVHSEQEFYPTVWMEVEEAERRGTAWVQCLTGCTGSRGFQENLEESEQNGWLEIAGGSRGRRWLTRPRGVWEGAGGLEQEEGEKPAPLFSCSIQSSWRNREEWYFWVKSEAVVNILKRSFKLLRWSLVW